MTDRPEVADRNTIFCAILSNVTGKKLALCHSVVELSQSEGRKILDQVYGEGNVERAVNLTNTVMQGRSPK